MERLLISDKLIVQECVCRMCVCPGRRATQMQWLIIVCKSEHTVSIDEGENERLCEDVKPHTATLTLSPSSPGGPRGPAGPGRPTGPWMPSRPAGP